MSRSALSGVAFTNNGVEIMRTVKSYDMLNRLTNIVSTTNGAALSKFAYLYNSANQRTRATMVDGSYWLWGYDNLGQVTSAKRYWSDSSPVAGQQFEYAFDTIGNRVTTKTGGDRYGANLRQADYGANFLNQYTNRSIPGFVEVQGSAHSNATVSVWGDNGSWSPTVRRGDYFRGELAVTNSSASVWLGFTNIAVLNTATNDIITNIVGHTFVPQTPEAFTHDLDGNLTGDGKWTYTWDAENRLIAMGSVAAVPNTAKKKLEFGYDSMWRRTSKIVSTNLNGTYYPAYTNYFVYDGWNLIAILGPESTVVRSFTWGLDLSGSLQGAGGVGGLLAVADSSLGSHFASFDGNGNLTALLNATTRTESGRYEFGPFGELLRANGPMATANPFRFSTKYLDDETGLLYYGYRYYDTSTGRWTGRDPIEEAGGLDLYAFVNNDPLSAVDVAGQMAHKTVPLKDYWDEWKKCHPRFTESQYDEIKQTLDRGCVGITCINLGEPGMPDMSNCYSSLTQAQKRKKEMEKNCECKGKRNWKGGASNPRIYSTRYYSEGNPYAPDPNTGKVDMSGWKFHPKPGYVNFDYGFQCGKDQWTHANHCEPGMEVYQSDLAYYSRPLLDFDKQVFCVTCEDWKFGPCVKPKTLTSPKDAGN